jgi:periplasmic protein CpxP/Spy
MLKHCLLTLMLAGLVYAGASVAVAQDNGGNDQQAAPSGMRPDHGGGRGEFDPAKRAEMLGKKLKLSSDQQTKVEGILKDEQSQMESLRSNSSTSQEDRRSKMMEIHKSSSSQIRALLDSDQQKKWDEMQNSREQWGHHRGGPGGQPDSQQ